LLWIFNIETKNINLHNTHQKTKKAIAKLFF